MNFDQFVTCGMTLLIALFTLCVYNDVYGNPPPFTEFLLTLHPRNWGIFNKFNCGGDNYYSELQY